MEAAPSVAHSTSVEAYGDTTWRPRALDTVDREYAPIVAAFVNTVLFAKHSKSIPERSGREISTLALAMDCMLRGEVPKALDVMTQRLKALERSALDDGRATARWQELIPTSAALLTDRMEVRAGQSSERAEKKSRAKS